jgi:hypothetical protein
MRIAILVLSALVVTGCAAGTAEGPPASAPASPSERPGASASPGPSETGGQYRVRYGWAVPSTRTEVANQVPVPLPGIPLPYLVEIHVGDHPAEDPAYSRISFYFRGAFPAYNFNYARQVVSEGQGDPLPLEGNAFLRLQFVNAQAHDNAGRSTVRTAADQHIGYRNLRGYGFGGDFEGTLTYGLGIQVAAGGDQALPIRIGELKRPDGFCVVAVDVRG